MATTKLTGTLIRSGSIPTTALGGGVFSSSVQLSSALPSGTVSSSAQVKPLLPDGTVSSSTQYPGWVTASSQVQLNGITGTTFSNAAFSFPQNLNVGGTLTAREIQTEYVTSSIIYESGSTKFGDTADDTHQFTGSLSVLGTISGALILPSGVVTASSQIDITATTNYTTFSSSIATANNSQDLTISSQTTRIDNLASLTSSYAINSTIQSQLAGVPSSSSQVKEYLPDGTISSSTQINVILDLDNVVSSSAQIDITATTNYSTFSSSIATKDQSLELDNDLQDVSINALNAATSSYALQSQLAGVASSSGQVKTYLPDGTVSSSAQFPGLVTSSTQIALSGVTGNIFSSGDFSFPQNLTISGSLITSGTITAAFIAGMVSSSTQVDYNSIQNKLSGVVSSSTQVQPLLPADTVSASAQVKAFLPDGSVSSSAQYPGWITSSTQVVQSLPGGTVSSSTQVKAFLPADTVSSSGQVDITATTNYATFSSSIATKNDLQDVSINALNTATSSYAINSTIQGQLAGVVSSSTQVKPLLPDGTVSSSTQVTANLPAGVVSSSAQLPAGTVSSSGQVDITATTNYTTFSSSLATVDQNQQSEINGLKAATGSYAINATIQGQLAGVASSSSQVKAFLPADTVSSSAQYPGWVTASSQVDITATTNYTTFSSSIATKNDVQDVSINALNTATSSYAINATIQSQLAGVASSSAQVKAYLPDGTVSSSGQVDITATTGYSTFSSSIATANNSQDLTISNQTTRIDNLASLTSSYAINATIQSQLAGVVSSSTQVKPLLPDGTVSSSGQVVVQNTTGIGALATTGSNTFNANQTITGSLFISQNLTVLGSSSIGFISQSTLDIGTNIITVNTLSPGTRFGGLSVIDSGSSPKLSGSIFFDSLKDEWIFIHQQAAGAGVTSSLFLMGPQTFNDVGNETNLTTNKIPKSQNAEHLSDSQISDNGVTVSITNGLTVGTNLTASNATISGLTANQAVFTDANDQLVSVATTGTGDVVRAASPTLTGTLTAANITATGTMLLAGIISQSSQVSLTGTTGYSTFSSSIATKNDLQDVSINALNAATSSYAVNSTIQGQLAGVVSSSAQVKPLLPDGTVSSSAQFPGWVTASSQVTITGISGLGANVATFLGTPSSANLATAVTDETGTGALVFAGSPTLTGTVTANNIVMSGSQFAGIVSGSGTQYRLVVPVGTNQYAT
jgi:ribosome-associated protein YbcJ (S4-like RNA binding protein)